MESNKDFVSLNKTYMEGSRVADKVIGQLIEGAYDPKPIEDKWYSWWLDKGLFHADVKSNKPPFSIVIPPPNVTGSLHMGHALNNTIQDIVCRYKRMCGFNVLWLPGTDHAGIATQNVVEREIAKEGLTRQELGREKFLERVWQWKEIYGNRIITQLKKLGASCDWERERFTLDEGLSRAVREVFVRLYKEGLIYKGKYIVNWCPRCHTALSDLEVEHKEENGKLYYVAYPIVGEDGEVVVATTRPETILGDVAIAIHPRDERNRHLIGKKALVPIVNREIPIIEDNMVDPEFGTGCVKITPAHDPNDFLVGKRHNLPALQVMDENAVMNENAGKYKGLDRYECRKVFVNDLEKAGYLRKIEDHVHAIGRCYRCNTVIEPYLSTQWFVKTKPLAEKGIKAVKEGKIRFIPEQWVNTYYQWMENIRDWCISRQLWWGHRIPAWYCDDCNHITVSSYDPDVCEKCGSKNIHQDEDVLDTWFSSALWPFSTLGWPDDTPELKIFYPTSLLVTGFDIIFFWVARMIMMGLHFMKDVPFYDVYIHALVRDEHGQKMSKSKGNVIDPLDIIERYGADSLRFTLAALTVQGRDVMLSENKIETYKHFMNKIWNAARLVLMHINGEEVELVDRNNIDMLDLKLHDMWILKRLNSVIEEVTELLEGYYFGEAARKLYDFIWGEFCDWYLEMSKPALRKEEGDIRYKTAKIVALTVFMNTLKLLHPFIPFLTEELWHIFKFSEEGRSIEEEKWPSVHDLPFEDKSKLMEIFAESVRAIRNLRAELQVPPQRKVEVAVFFSDNTAESVIKENEVYLRLLAGVSDLEYLSSKENRPKNSFSYVLPFGEVYIKLSGLVDLDKERKRLQKELERVEVELERVNKKLLNKNFVEKAPLEVVEKEKKKKAELEDVKNRLLQNLRDIS